MADNVMWIKLNSGEVVERPYREAVRLLSRRLADPAEAPVAETIPLEGDEPNDRDLRPYAENYSRDELIELAKTYDLPTSGNKLDLVERLIDANVELSTAPAAGATPEDVPGESGSSPDEQS